MAVARRILIVLLGLVVAAGVVAAIVFFVTPRGPGGPSTPAEQLPDFVPAAPVERAETPTGPGISGLADPVWLDRVAAATGIPRRALAAYAGQAIVTDEQTSCALGWNALAAIGEIESHHGSINGSSIGEDGAATPPIYGIGLHGDGTDSVPDSDRGVIDGDPAVDRAVGPMQLIPQSWRNWHIDASGDGVEDPQNIDDAVAAAAHYLCRASGQAMGAAEGWQTGILAYNGSQRYFDDVTRWAQRYAELAADR